MKIKKSQLKKVIQEELSAVLGETKASFFNWMDMYGKDYLSGAKTNPSYSKDFLANWAADMYRYYDTGKPPTPYDPNDPEGPNPTDFSPVHRNVPLIPKTASGDTTPSATDSALPALGLDPDPEKGSITLPKKTFKLPDAPAGDYGDPPDQEPRKGPLTDPPKFDSPKPREGFPSGPKKTFLRPGYTPVSEALKQIIIQELAVVLLEKEDPIEPAEIPNYIAGLKSQAAGSETSAGIAMSTLQAIVGMAAENPQLAAAAAMASQALESIPKEAETAAKDAMKA